MSHVCTHAHTHIQTHTFARTHTHSIPTHTDVHRRTQRTQTTHTNIQFSIGYSVTAVKVKVKGSVCKFVIIVNVQGQYFHSTVHYTFTIDFKVHFMYASIVGPALSKTLVI